MELKDKKGLKKVAGLFSKKQSYTSEVAKEILGLDLKVNIKVLDSYARRCLTEQQDQSKLDMLNVLKKNKYKADDCRDLIVSLVNQKEFDELMPKLKKKYGNKIEHMQSLFLKLFQKSQLESYEIVKPFFLSIDGYEDLTDSYKDSFDPDFKIEVVDKIESLSVLGKEDKENLQ